MRANESLPLTLQADAAFLVRVAKMGLLEAGMEKGQMRRTLEIIRQGVRRAAVGAEVRGIEEVEA